MKPLWRELWIDEAGFVASSELILVALILMIGAVAGLSSVRDAVVGELADIGAAIGDLNHSFSYAAVTSDCGSAEGSAFADESDFCDLPGADGFGDNNDRICQAPLCITICLAPAASPE